MQRPRDIERRVTGPICMRPACRPCGITQPRLKRAPASVRPAMKMLPPPPVFILPARRIAIRRWHLNKYAKSAKNNNNLMMGPRRAQKKRMHAGTIFSSSANGSIYSVPWMCNEYQDRNENREREQLFMHARRETPGTEEQFKIKSFDVPLALSWRLASIKIVQGQQTFTQTIRINLINAHETIAFACSAVKRTGPKIMCGGDLNAEHLSRCMNHKARRFQKTCKFKKIPGEKT